ncbi:MAG: hypothetical protein U0470_08415 [Anaerolineae bacterium]
MYGRALSGYVLETDTLVQVPGWDATPFRPDGRPAAAPAPMWRPGAAPGGAPASQSG